MNKLALFTAAGAALMMISGVALAQDTTHKPSTMGASKSHMGNPPPSGHGPSNPNAPATDKRNNAHQKGPASSSGGHVSSDPTNQNPRTNVK